MISIRSHYVKVLGKSLSLLADPIYVILQKK